MRLFSLLLAALCLACVLAQPVQAQVTRRRSEPNLKIGLNRWLLSGYTYTLETTPTPTTSVSNSDGMQGNELFVEYIFFGRIGVELGYGLTAMQRSYDLSDAAGTLVASVDESVRSAAIGANLYFNRTTGRGLKYFLGLGTGTMAVSQDFKGGAGAAVGPASSSLSVPYNTVKLGVDWNLENAGLRLTYQMLSGAASDTEAISGFKQTYDYTASLLTLGVFAFF